MRIEELKHHIRIESAVLEGGKNAIKLLQKTKSQDKKALHEAQNNVFQASCKVELLRMSLEKRVHELSPDDVNSNMHKAELLRWEMDSSPNSRTITKAQQYSVVAKAAALSGKLHCRCVLPSFINAPGLLVYLFQHRWLPGLIRRHSISIRT
jgi:protein kinase N